MRLLCCCNDDLSVSDLSVCARMICFKCMERVCVHAFYHF
jgi:hypothetical protein